MEIEIYQAQIEAQTEIIIILSRRVAELEKLLEPTKTHPIRLLSHGATTPPGI